MCSLQNLPRVCVSLVFTAAPHTSGDCGLRPEESSWEGWHAVSCSTFKSSISPLSPVTVSTLLPHVVETSAPVFALRTSLFWRSWHAHILLIYYCNRQPASVWKGESVMFFCKPHKSILHEHMNDKSSWISHPKQGPREACLGRGEGIREEERGTQRRGGTNSGC